MDELITDMARRALAGERLSRDDVLALAAAGQENPHDLMYWANRLRRAHFAMAVRLCAIVPGKMGACTEDCKWCAQSARHSAGCEPSVSSCDDILAAGRQARQNGATSLGIVNSGRRPTAADISAAVTAAQKLRGDVGNELTLCASLGELTDSQARRLVAAGFTRYNHNLETSRRMYPQVVTTHTYGDRLRTLEVARRAGLSICCGGLFGLGETWEDRVDLAIALRDEVRPEVVPLNFLHPIPGTPLGNTTPPAPLEILTVIAMFRLVLPTVDIKVAGGREHNLRDMQSWIFYAGATSCLVGNYLTTSGRSVADDLQMIADLGMRVAVTCEAQHNIYYRTS